MIPYLFIFSELIQLHASTTELETFYVSRSKECTIMLTVSNLTSSGHHKVG
jgi:hypothetical protein